MFRELDRINDHSGYLTEKQIEEMLNSNLFGIISCINENGYPMTVPIHIVYYQDCVYFHTANTGEKFDSINKNSKVSLLVYEKRDKDDDSNWTMYDSVLIYGTCSFLDPFSDEGSAALKELAIHCGMPGKATDKYIAKLGPKCVAGRITVDHISGRYLHVH